MLWLRVVYLRTNLLNFWISKQFLWPGCIDFICVFLQLRKKIIGRFFSLFSFLFRKKKRKMETKIFISVIIEWVVQLEAESLTQFLLAISSEKLFRIFKISIFFSQNSILERKNEWKIKIKKLFVCYFSKFDKCSLMAAHELKCFSFDFILFIKIYIVDLAENFCLTIFWLGLEKVEKVFWSRKFPFGHEKIVKNLFRSKTKINNSN